MFFRICKIAILLLTIISCPAFGQSGDAEKQRAEYEKKAKEELDKRTQEFVSSLQIDDFQKEIIKQKINSYFEERKKIYLNLELKYFERDEQLTALSNTHFTDIKNIITDDTYNQIQSFIKDGGEELKKKKRKNKKKKD